MFFSYVTYGFLVRHFVFQLQLIWILYPQSSYSNLLHQTTVRMESSSHPGRKVKRSSAFSVRLDLFTWSWTSASICHFHFLLQLQGPSFTEVPPYQDGLGFPAPEFWNRIEIPLKGNSDPLGLGFFSPENLVIGLGFPLLKTHNGILFTRIL